MQLSFHHFGVACEDIMSTLAFVRENLQVREVGAMYDDPLQDAQLCMVELADGLQLELISGPVVKNYVKKGLLLYHTCWQVPCIDTALQGLLAQGGMLISPPKEAVLFGGRRVAFLHTVLGLVELLETQETTHPAE